MTKDELRIDYFNKMQAWMQEECNTRTIVIQGKAMELAAQEEKEDKAHEVYIAARRAFALAPND